MIFGFWYSVMLMAINEMDSKHHSSIPMQDARCFMNSDAMSESFQTLQIDYAMQNAA